MSLFVTSLNSGSNGNCFYVGTPSEAVLIDAGISCREIQKRMNRLDLSLKNVRGVFITHEHSDHIRGLEILTKKFDLDVYINPGTLRNSGLKLDSKKIRKISHHQVISFQELQVTAFPKSHDAADPVSFVVESGETTVGIFTDIGVACEEVTRQFRRCHAAFLETNFDESMLENGNYPPHLKKRIRGDQGHLSNQEAYELFRNHRPEFMTHLFPSHLSENNNHPDLVKRLFDTEPSGVKVILASRYQEIPVCQISATASGNIIPPPKSPGRSSQLSLPFQA